ncbi:HAD-IA family hydrolase [Leptospira sp. 201903070]|uniref:phosphoglycolate phosphatase n=1 Tax=Leptospira ainlahdjerensis TaxID=2810033 RepID=A0ABS2UDI7_9LEPT|nr:HAD-IA family hydrolase [Leptospira ainlahdjerensis]MBM9577834.1 HAD-IA family hydrolase [Leptospira ainlahdjerensis]
MNIEHVFGTEEMGSVGTPKMKIKAILFDYDDTLVQTRKIRYGTLKDLAREIFQFELKDSHIDDAWGLPGDDFLRRVYGKFSEDLESLWEVYNSFCERDPNLTFPGVEDFLQKYGSTFHFGILSSSSGRRVLKEMEYFSFSKDSFFAIQTAEDTKVHKPNPKVFLPILEEAKRRELDSSEILYIGDTLGDATASLGAGLRFLGMAHEGHSAKIFQDENLEFVSSFLELGRWIEF